MALDKELTRTIPTEVGVAVMEARVEEATIIKQSLNVNFVVNLDTLFKIVITGLI